MIVECCYLLLRRCNLSCNCGPFFDLSTLCTNANAKAKPDSEVVRDCEAEKRSRQEVEQGSRDRAERFEEVERRFEDVRVEFEAMKVQCADAELRCVDARQQCDEMAKKYLEAETRVGEAEQRCAEADPNPNPKPTFASNVLPPPAQP